MRLANETSVSFSQLENSMILMLFMLQLKKKDARQCDHGQTLEITLKASIN